mmetsp:Transcript_12875/g.38024  ORF Transcript_12875/g.38024 Transcript_12875/m.38024 type:complete len:676 (+) Transcript_12875:129-2156(+)
MSLAVARAVCGPPPRVCWTARSKVVRLRVLLCQLEQHRVVEELVDGHVLAQPLPAARLDHELAREVRRRLRLERAEGDVLVERVARHDGPVVKDGEAEGLPLRVRAHVRLEAERVDDGQVGLDRVEGRAGARPLGRDVPAPAREHGVDRGHAVDGRADVDEEDGLHQPRRRHQEGRVGDAARGRDHLPAAAVDRLGRHRGVEDLELDVAHRLVAERALAARPREALQDEVADTVQQLLVHLGRERVVHEHVGALVVGAEAPHRARREQVPVVPLLEELAQPLPLPPDVDGARLDVLGDPLVERLRYHRQLRLAVRRLGKALERRRLDDRLAKGDHGVGDLDLDLGVDVPQVVHHAVEVQLARPHNDVLARLLHLGREQRVRLVELAQPLEHLRQLGRVERLRRDLHRRERVEGERAEDAHALARHARRAGGDGARLDERRVDALDERPAAGGHLVHLEPVARLVEPQARDGPARRVLLVVERVRLAEHIHLLPNLERAREHAAERVEGLAVGPVVHLGHVDHQQARRVARRHAAHKVVAQRARVGVLHLCRRRRHRRRQVRNARVGEPGVGAAEEAAHHELEEGLWVERILLLAQRHAEVAERRLEVLLRLGDRLRHELVQRLEDELDKRARPAPLGRLAPEAARVWLEVDVSPQPARKGGGLEVGIVLGVQRGE